MNIANIISDCSPEDARSCLYYASRYIKQAESYNEYSKDIFEDEERSAPSARVRDTTMQFIRAVEAREGSSAADFDDDTFMRIMKEIATIEADLPSDLSQEELERGVLLASDMTTPLIARYGQGSQSEPEQE